MHRAWGGAVYANMARNLTRYDVADTRLGLIASTGVVPPDEFEFYYHHPPLNVWAMAVSFRALGVAESSARAVPLVASLVGIWLVYLLSAELYSRRVGLAAATLLALTPGEVYYADHVDPYGSLGLVFALLGVWGYARWHRSASGGDLVLCSVGVLGGCLVTWTPYFAVPLILLHAAITIPREQWRERAGLLILPLCGIAAFAFFVFHRQILLGSADGELGDELYGSLLEKLASRGAWASWFGAEGSGAAAGWSQHGRDVWRLFTPLPLVLFGVWVLDLVRRSLSGRVAASDGIPLILIGYGLFHDLVFPGTLYGHDFLARSYSAGLALCGGIVLARAWDWLCAKGGLLPAVACAAAVLGLWCYLALPRLAELRARSWDPAQLVARAQRIRGVTDEDTRVLMSVEPDRVLQYYIDRPLEFEVDTPARLKELSAEGRDAVWLVTPGRVRAASRALRNVPYAKRQVAGMVLYRIRTRP
jgi:hypothetical protein